MKSKQADARSQGNESKADENKADANDTDDNKKPKKSLNRMQKMNALLIKEDSDEERSKAQSGATPYTFG